MNNQSQSIEWKQSWSDNYLKWIFVFADGQTFESTVLLISGNEFGSDPAKAFEIILME